MTWYEDECRAGANPQDCGSFLKLARLQMKRAFIPTLVAVAASVLINRMGSPLLLLAALVLLCYLYCRGFRLKVVLPRNPESMGGPRL